MVRIFAVEAAVDLVCTVLLLGVLVLLVSVPTLAEPFSHFLCHAVTTGDFATLWMTLGGIEVCEEHWKWGVGAIIGGAAVAVALRACGTAITWQHHANMIKAAAASSMTSSSDRAIEMDEWYDAEMIHKERTDAQRRRDVEMRRSERQRASTLPILWGAATTSEQPLPLLNGRYRSRSSSQPSSTMAAPDGSRRRPQLVLVPVLVDEQNNISPPPSGTFPPVQYVPTFATPPRRKASSSASSSLSSASGSRSCSTTSCRRSATSTSPRLPFLQPTSPTFCAEPEPYSSADSGSDRDSSSFAYATRPKLTRGRSRSDVGMVTGKMDSGYGSLLEGKLGPGSGSGPRSPLLSSSSSSSSSEESSVSPLPVPASTSALDSFR